MRNYLYLFLIGFALIILFSLLFRYGWVLLVIWLLVMVARFIHSLFHKEEQTQEKTYTTYEDPNDYYYDNTSSSYTSSSSQDIIDADYKVVEEEDAHN